MSMQAMSMQDVSGASKSSALARPEEVASARRISALIPLLSRPLESSRGRLEGLDSDEKHKSASALQVKNTCWLFLRAFLRA